MSAIALSYGESRGARAQKMHKWKRVGLGFVGYNSISRPHRWISPGEEYKADALHAALSDLKSITFIRMKRSCPAGDCTYEISPSMDDVLGALCAVRRMQLSEVSCFTQIPGKLPGAGITRYPPSLGACVRVVRATLLRRSHTFAVPSCDEVAMWCEEECNHRTQLIQLA